MLHPDLLAVKRLESLDRIIDRAIADITALENGVRDAVGAWKKTKAHLDELKARFEEVRTEERRLERKMHSYVKRRDDTKALIDEGRAPDFLVAQRQLEQCTEIVDETELLLLEQIDVREALEADIQRVEQALVQAEHQLNVARKNRNDGRPPLEARIKELRPERKLVHAELPSDLRNPYDSLRKQKKPILTHLRGGYCTHCHIQARAQVALEVEKHRAAHRCSGCGAWLLDVLDEPEEDEQTED